MVLVRPWMRVALVAAFGIALVAGCGDDGATTTATTAGSGSGSGSGTESTETTAADGSEDTTGSTAAEGGAPDGCPLTADEVSEITGIAVAEPEDEGTGGGSGCTFTGDAAQIVALRIFDDGETAHAAFESAFEEAEPVEGIGDEALFDSSLGTLSVRSGDIAIQTQVVGAEGDAQEMCVDLAQAIIDSL